jgi:hemoglobin
MKPILLPLTIGLALAWAPAQAKESLYDRLGGYDGITVFADAFIGKLAAHPSLGRFFVGHSTSSNARIRQLIVDFVCNKAGGPCLYTGRSMVEAHTGLKITEQDWTDSLAAFTATMDELKVDKPVQEEVAAFVVTLKPDIVGR